MKKITVLILIYALLILIGGIFGHLKAGSTISLYTGILSGVFLISCCTGIYFNKRWGILGSLSFLFVLDAFFTYRFLITKKFFPSGAMTLISLITLGIMITFLRRYSPSGSSHVQK